MELTVNAPVIGLVLTVIGNLLLITWGASKVRTELTHLGENMKAEIAHLSTALNRLSDVLDHLDDQVSQHETRITVLEDRRANP